MHTIEEMSRRRSELGLTYAELSELCNVPVPTLQKIFSGTTRSPHYSTMLKLEDALFADQLIAGKMLREPVATYQVNTKHSRRNPLLSGLQGSYTLKDYSLLPEDERWELIDGILIRMEAPSVEHQSICTFLAAQLYRFTEEEESCPCYVLTSPCDVQLDGDDRTIVQPDLFVCCDESKLSKQRCVGAPDLCIEILSHSTRSKDQLLKRYKYERAGVKEFWVVDPEYNKITVYCFGRQPEEKTYSMRDRIPISICEGRHAVDFSRWRLPW